MSGRGKPAYERPVTPPDPTLSARSVPSARNAKSNNTLSIKSMGPGSASNILGLIKPLEDIDAAVNYAELQSNSKFGFRSSSRPLLKQIVDWENVQFREDGSDGPYPTWGFYAFVTAYSDRAREQLPLALDNLTKIQRRALEYASPPSAYAEEAFQRFRLDVVQDKDALEGASDDRIRAEFRALVRGLELTDEPAHIPPQACWNTCVVVDEDAIEMLAIIEFPDDLKQDYRAFQDKMVKVVDINFDRSLPPDSEHEGYRGTGRVGISWLSHFYEVVTSAANSGAMMDLHPLNGSPS